jgi:hypothetical protein
MLFGQLAYRESLRDIVTCLKAHKEKLYHLGFRSEIKRSTLSDANKNRNWNIYRDIAISFIDKVRPMLPVSDEIKKIGLDATVYLIDSTIIDLCLSVFNWTKFDRTHSAIKLNM